MVTNANMGQGPGRLLGAELSINLIELENAETEVLDTTLCRGLISRKATGQLEVHVKAVVCDYILKLAAFSLALSLSSMGAAAATLSQRATCGGIFPYSADVFLAKLLAVADDPNPIGLPKRFESVFDVRLAGSYSSDRQEFSLKSHCSWFTQVSIATNQAKSSTRSGGTFRFVSLTIGGLDSKIRPSLYFRDGDGCLTADRFERTLQSDGWIFRGRNDGFSVFKKNHASLNAVLWSREASSLCITSLLFIFDETTN